MRRFKPRELHYSVQCLCDGTIVFAVPGNKPHNNRGIQGDIVDQDCCQWLGEFERETLQCCSDWGKGLIHGGHR